jgi:hypothetical protein
MPAVITDRVREGNLFAPFHWNDLYGEYLAINAVTNDAVDPLSFQPEFKVCAVTVTVVAKQPVDIPAVTEPVLSDVFRLPASPPELTDDEKRYLAGFLQGVGARPLEGAIPVLPAGAPFSADRALWVNGVLAGMFSRVPAVPAPVVCSVGLADRYCRRVRRRHHHAKTHRRGPRARRAMHG